LFVRDKVVCTAGTYSDAEKDTHKVEYVKSGGERVELSHEEVGAKFSFEYVERIVFLHERDLRSCIFQCIERNDQCAEWLHAMRSHLQANITHPGVSLRHIGEVDGVDYGHGVFTEEFVSKGTYIGEYVGLVSSVSETVTRDNHYNFQYPSCDGGLEINGREFGNLMRFINHSTSPNAEFRAISLDDIMHIICVSKPCVTYAISCAVAYSRSA
jgi:hypothetical protein